MYRIIVDAVFGDGGCFEDLVWGFRMEDGWLVKNGGDDEDAKMDPRRRPAGMTEWGEDGEDSKESG